MRDLFSKMSARLSERNRTFLKRDLLTGWIVDDWHNANPRVVQLANDILEKHDKPFRWYPESALKQKQIHKL